MSQDPADVIARQDEILELLYWLEGEGIGGASTLAAMARFVSRPADELAATLGALVARGDVEKTADDEYRLTRVGRREAGRRFAEEFAGMTAQGHGECNDPTCDCHDNPEAAAECHAARASKPGTQ